MSGDAMPSASEPTTTSAAATAMATNATSSLSAKNLYAIVGETVKTVDESGPEPVVVEFDAAVLNSYCDGPGGSFEKSIDPAALCKHLFPPEEWWSSKKLLLDALRAFAKLQGWKPTTEKTFIRCSLGVPDSKRMLLLSGGVPRPCTFVLYLKAKHTLDDKNRPDYGRETKIVTDTRKNKSCWDCGGVCPCAPGGGGGGNGVADLSLAELRASGATIPAPRADEGRGGKRSPKRVKSSNKRGRYEAPTAEGELSSLPLHVPSNLVPLLRTAAMNLGKPDYDVSTVDRKLGEDWFQEVDHLLGRTVEFLHRYMPYRLAEEVARLVKEVRQRVESEHYGKEGGDVAAPPPTMGSSAVGDAEGEDEEGKGADPSAADPSGGEGDGGGETMI